MSPRKKKEKRSPLATIFLVDPWRKILALCLGFFVWSYLSSQINKSVVLDFRVVQLAEGSTDYKGYALNIPATPGFILWRVNKAQSRKGPVVSILFQGPNRRMQGVTKDLKLIVPPDKLGEIGENNTRITIKANDIIVTQKPELNELISEILGDKLELTFVKHLKGKEHTLGKGEVLIKGDAYPEGYERDEEREIEFSPRLVTLSGPARFIINELKNITLPSRPRLLNDLVLDPSALIQHTPNGGPHIVADLTLRKEWQAKGIKIKPGSVTVRVPLRRIPFKINIPSLRLKIHIVGKDKDKWEIPKGVDDSKPILLNVFNKKDWAVINNFKRLEDRPNPKAQERWARENIFLFVNSSHLPEKHEGELYAHVHWAVLYNIDDFLFAKPDIIVEVGEAAQIALRMKKTK